MKLKHACTFISIVRQEVKIREKSEQKDGSTQKGRRISWASILKKKFPASLNRSVYFI